MRTQIRSAAVIASMLAAVLLVSSFGVNSAEARSRHHGRGNAAVAGAVLGVFGTIAALAARDAYRDRYYGYGSYDPYYGAAYGYYPRPGYRYRHWHRRHHHW
ncbi:MAG TPA: hypothetical protein VFC54_12285 [Pseudolabrys sp.]|nr:hypothetical protein [Pseudolabrys sp.]